MGEKSWFLDLVCYRTQRQWASCEQCHIPVTTSWACPSGGTVYSSTNLGTNPEF